MKRLLQILIGAFAALLVLALGVVLRPMPASAWSLPSANGVLSPAALEQGCVNQGEDRRKLGKQVCWLQRQLSWKSEREPAMAFIGNRQRRHLGVAWPPYVVYNAPEPTGRWFMARVGFRYDRVWRGYIFPTLAIKRIAAPLSY